MADHDVFANEKEVEADLVLLESLRWSRKEFLDRVGEASVSKDEQVLATLRLESTYQIAEFYYLLRVRRIKSDEDIRLLADLHNQYVVELMKDAAKVARLGLTPERLLDAMFTADTMPRLLQHWREQPGALDQSNLARFLVTVMSTETCRKIVMAGAAAGFLERQRSPFGTMLVASTGILEQIFGRCVRDLRRRIDGGQ
jgi:hypothetical protein